MVVIISNSPRNTIRNPRTCDSHDLTVAKYGYSGCTSQFFFTLLLIKKKGIKKKVSKIKFNPTDRFIITFLTLILNFVNINSIKLLNLILQRNIFYFFLLQILFNIMNRIIKKIPISAQVKKLKTKYNI